MKPKTKWILAAAGAAAYLLWRSSQNQGNTGVVGPPAVTGTSLTSTNPYVVKVPGSITTGLPIFPTLGGRRIPPPPPPPAPSGPQVAL